jgi:hypothetical protein
VVVDDLGHGFRREVQPGARRVRGSPALHLVEVLLDVVRREGLTVLEAHLLAQPQFQGLVVQPLRVLGERHHSAPVLVDADRLLHRVPRDEQLVQW